MPGGLLQLVAIGVQDTKLTEKPEITFFKAVYRRYVNFAAEAIEQTFTGQADFDKKVSVEFTRNGDLITNVLLELTLPAVDVAVINPDLTDNQGNPIPFPGPGFAWAPNIGQTILEEIKMFIGGQVIDTHYGYFYNIWDTLTLPAEKEFGFNEMIGQQNLVQIATDPADVIFQFQGLQTPFVEETSTGNKPQVKLYIPIRFWFSQNSGLALPIIALLYHQIKMDIKFRKFVECYVLTPNTQIVGGNPSLVNAQIYCDYIYLDNDERKVYAQNPHEYLITQLQFNNAEGVNTSAPRLRMNFNHPIKEIIWVVQEDGAVAANVNQWTNWETFDTTGTDQAGLCPVVNAKIQLNGQDRFSVRDGLYFSRVQPYYHHTRIPNSKGVFVYSFALNPEDYQPSGTANFSRIDNAFLILTLQQISMNVPGKVYIYGINYNLFRVASGLNQTPGPNSQLPLRSGKTV